MEYINKFYRGNQASFARLTGVQPAQVTQWINKGFIVVNHTLFDILHALKDGDIRRTVSCCLAEKRKPRS
ncbi:hypothetical protein EJG75_19505 [Salmonella enterica subsp. enterica]|nr:hypothetical protein [Escherichia coli]ECI6198842.1 hypothetical protein [Salmonella enterica subsp. enterica]EDE5527269.1 hypothetical protein [Salmonella enterica subsp. enterica serovar Enteritidis]